MYVNKCIYQCATYNGVQESIIKKKLLTTKWLIDVVYFCVTQLGAFSKSNTFSMQN